MLFDLVAQGEVEVAWDLCEERGWFLPTLLEDVRPKWVVIHSVEILWSYSAGAVYSWTDVEYWYLRSRRSRTRHSSHQIRRHHEMGFWRLP